MENNDMQKQMDEEYRAAERENAAYAGDRYRDWNDAMARQREGEFVSLNQREYDSFQALNGRIHDTDLQLDRRKGVAGVAMLMNAYQNGGMSRREMSGAFSEALGKPVYGMQILGGLTGDEAKYNGSAAVYGVVNDNGKPGVGVIARINPLQQLKMLQSAKLGDRTREVESRLYKTVSQSLTEDQLLKMGIKNPDGPYVTGGVSGKAVSRLFGRGGDRHSRISVFSTGGAGTGYTTREYDGHTGEDTGSVDHGQRDPNDPRYNGGWRLLSSGPGERLENGGYSQVRRYEGPNGEVIDVRDGESLSERIAEIRAKGSARGAGRGGMTAEERMAIEQAKGNGRLGAQAAKLDDNRVARVTKAYQERIAQLQKQMETADEKGKEDIKREIGGLQARIEAINGFVRDYNGSGESPAPAGQGSIVEEVRKPVAPAVTEKGGVSAKAKAAEKERRKRNGKDRGGNVQVSSPQPEAVQPKPAPAAEAPAASSPTYSREEFESHYRNGTDYTQDQLDAMSPEQYKAYSDFFEATPEYKNKMLSEKQGGGQKPPADTRKAMQAAYQKDVSSRMRDDVRSHNKPMKTTSRVARTTREAYEIARELGRDTVMSMSDEEIERVFRGGFSRNMFGDAFGIRIDLKNMFENDDRKQSLLNPLKKIFAGSGVKPMR